MPDTPVLIAGAGPAGLSLALGLRRHGVAPLVIEKEAATSRRSRAPGILPRSLEVFGQWGVADAILEAGIFLREVSAYSAATDEPLATVPLHALADESRYAGLCILEQGTTERILLEAFRDAGGEVRFDHELTGVTQDGAGVVATVRRGGSSTQVRARYLAACDGASSTVREALGLPFDGKTYDVDAVLADIRLPHMRNAAFPRVADDTNRLMFAVRLESGAWRMVSVERSGERRGSDVEPAEIHALEERLFGNRAGSIEWASRFRIHRRSVPRFRVGRVLLAGDAAHINSPAGAEGMNAAIHDAHNLAWKLALALRGGDEETLLESYHAERHYTNTKQVGGFTDRLTRTITAPKLLRRMAGRLAATALGVKPIRRRLLRRVMMISNSYGASPLLHADAKHAGRRVPDVELAGASGKRRLHDLLGLEPAIVSIDVETPVQPPAGLRHIAVGGELHETGSVLADTFGSGRLLLVRPDHFIAWSGSPDDVAGLRNAAAACLPGASQA